MINFDQALDWAESVSRVPATPRAQAAAELIKSLHGQLVDVEKVHEIIEEMNEYLEAEHPNDYGQGFNYATRHWREALESLFTPKLPTLADMTEEERQACLRAQAKTWYEVGILVWVDEDTEIAQLITRVNGVLERKFKDVTPLPDLPKLEWPGSEVVEPPALPEGMRLADHVEHGRVVVSPKMDEDDDYRFFYLHEHLETGAGWGYTKENKLTFLDGVE